ncbi:MAG: SHOCT domain-containing protein [Bacteroidota bacterium]
MNKNFDPTIIFVIIALAVMAGALKTPIFFWGIIGYVIYRVMNKNKKRDRSSRYERRDRTRDRQSTRRSQQEEYRERRERMEADYRRRRQENQKPRSAPARRPRPPKNNPYKSSGIKKYKEYEYEAAIEDFKKALEIDDRDIAVHFNIACAYSLTEQKEKSFFHLSQAVELGFKDFERIKTHDALAFLRIQDEFEAFQANGYQMTTNMKASTDEVLEENSALLEQLKQLAALRDKGLLTEDEFLLQKKKLLG